MMSLDGEFGWSGLGGTVGACRGRSTVPSL